VAKRQPLEFGYFHWLPKITALTDCGCLVPTNRSMSERNGVLNYLRVNFEVLWLVGTAQPRSAS
jgi:hypothetical protein